MSKRTLPLLLLLGFAASASAATHDAFVGEWKVNPSKSPKVIDHLKVESAAGNRYTFDLGCGPEALAADGKDHPGCSGTTLSATIEAPDSWKIVRKKEGRVLARGNWRLSKNADTFTDDYTEFAPDGVPSTVKYVYARTSGGSGFTGTWKNTTGAMVPVFVMTIQPYEEDGLSFTMKGITRNAKFDGKDYPSAGANVPPGSASSARRVNEHTLERTDKVNGKVTNTRELALSSDGKTLTMTVHLVGTSDPIVFVFDRQ